MCRTIVWEICNFVEYGNNHGWISCWNTDSSHSGGMSYDVSYENHRSKKSTAGRRSELLRPQVNAHANSICRIYEAIKFIYETTRGWALHTIGSRYWYLSLSREYTYISIAFPHWRSYKNMYLCIVLHMCSCLSAHPLFSILYCFLSSFNDSEAISCYHHDAVVVVILVINNLHSSRDLTLSFICRLRAVDRDWRARTTTW